MSKEIDPAHAALELLEETESLNRQADDDHLSRNEFHEAHMVFRQMREKTREAAILLREANDETRKMIKLQRDNLAEEWNNLSKESG